MLMFPTVLPAWDCTHRGTWDPAWWRPWFKTLPVCHREGWLLFMYL